MRGALDIRVVRTVMHKMHSTAPENSSLCATEARETYAKQIRHRRVGSFFNMSKKLASEFIRLVLYLPTYII